MKSFSTSLLQNLNRRCVATDNYVCYHIPIPAVIGIVFGAAFLLLLGIFIAFICVKRRRRVKKRRNIQGQEDTTLKYFGGARPEPIPFNPNAY
jgi:hypothetical protein